MVRLLRMSGASSEAADEGVTDIINADTATSMVSKLNAARVIRTMNRGMVAPPGRKNFVF
jgi:hypothetical protein